MSSTDLDRGTLNTPELEETNIHDVVGNYYLFYQSLAELRYLADTARDIGDSSRFTLCGLVDQLEGWWGCRAAYPMCVLVMYTYMETDKLTLADNRLTQHMHKGTHARARTHTHTHTHTHQYC